MKTRVFLWLFAILFIFTSKCFSQNYFYTSVKVPLGDFILHAISGNTEEDDYAKSDGALFDLGYAVQVNNLLAIEAGAEAYFFNPLTKRYNQRPNSVFDELDVTNRAFSAQVRPVVRLELDEGLFFRASSALNYRQLYSSGKFYTNIGHSTLQDVHNIASASSRSNFHLSLQPAIGLDIELDDNWILGLDVSYIRVNWNRSLDGLRFTNQPKLIMPQHRTSNMFLSGRIMFR